MHLEGRGRLTPNSQVMESAPRDLGVDSGPLQGIKLQSEVLGRAQVSTSSSVGEIRTQRQTEKEDKGETGC